MMLQFQRGCIPPFEFNPYSTWDDVSFVLMMVSLLALYTACAYYLLQGLKFFINALKDRF